MTGRVLDDHNRIVDDDPDGQHNTEQGQHIDRKPQARQNRKRADQGHRDRGAGHQRRSPILQEEVDDQHDEHDGHQQRRVDFGDRSLDEPRGIKRNLVFQSGRKRLAQFSQLGLDTAGHLQRIGAGQLIDRDRSARRRVESRVVGIALGAQLDARHVLDAGHSSAGGRLDNNVLEFLHVAQPPQRVDGVLKGGSGRRRRCTDLARRNLHVLLAKRGDDILGRQIASLQFVGIQPDPHGIVASPKDRHLADAGDPGQLVPEVDVRVVAQVDRIEAGVGRREGNQLDDLRGLFLDRDPLPAHLLGQLGLGDRHAVLDQHGRHVHVGADVEGDRQGVGSVAGAVGGHVQHVLDAVDLLLDRRSDGVGDNRGIGSRIERADLYRGRGDLREFGYGQTRLGDGPCDQDHQRDHRGEDRPANEKTR